MVYRLTAALFVVLVALPVSVAGGPADPSVVLDSGGLQFPDGSLQETAHPGYAHRVVVAKEGGHFASISAAILSITGGTDSPAEDNEYLVEVMPGVYEEQVTMASWVDVHGVGLRLVKIRHTGGATVLAASDSEIAGVTIQNLPDTGEAVAVHAVAADRFSIRNARVEADGGAASRAVVADDSLVYLRDVEIEARDAVESIGIHGLNNNYVRFVGGSIIVPSMAASANGYGIWNDASTSRLLEVEIDSWGTSTARGIKNEANGSTSLERCRVAAFVNSSAADAAAYGIDLDAGGLWAHQMRVGIVGGSTAGLSFALRGQNSSYMEIHHSDISAYGDVGDYAATLAGSEAHIVYTGLQGLIGPFGAPGNYNCLGAYAYTGAMVFTVLGPTCQPLGP